MKDASQLLLELSSAVESGNKEDATHATNAILDLPFETKDQIRAKHRLALHLYLVEKKLVDGMALFKAIAKAQIPCEETCLSQISLSMGFWAVGRKDNAIFELRKVISEEKGPTPIKAMALQFLCLFLKEMGGHERELETAQNDHIATLSHLTKSEAREDDVAHFKLLLATALEERGTPADLEKAIAVNNEIVKTKAAQAPTASLAREALKRLSSNRRK